MRFSQINSFARSVARIAEATGTRTSVPGLLVTYRGRQETPVCVIGKDPRDNSSSLFLARSGESEGRIVMKTTPKGPTTVQLKIPGTKRAPLQLNLLTTGQPALVLCAMDGPQIVLTVDPDGKTAKVLLADDQGATRAKLGLRSDGSPELVFFDANGNETWRAGQ